MNIREEMISYMYELACNENLYPELDKASEKMISMCATYFQKEKEDDYLKALFTVERKAFIAGVNMVLDFISWRERKHE